MTTFVLSVLDQQIKTEADSLSSHVSLSLSNNILWNILEEPNLINTSEFEDLFAKTTTQTKRKPLSEVYEKKAKARKVTCKINLTNMQNTRQVLWYYLQYVACPLEGVIALSLQVSDCYKCILGASYNPDLDTTISLKSFTCKILNSALFTLYVSIVW